MFSCQLSASSQGRPSGVIFPSAHLRTSPSLLPADAPARIPCSHSSTSEILATLAIPRRWHQACVCELPFLPWGQGVGLKTKQEQNLDLNPTGLTQSSHAPGHTAFQVSMSELRIKGTRNTKRKEALSPFDGNHSCFGQEWIRWS